MNSNGNVLGYTDSVMGSWSFGYDQLNRLVTAANTALPTPNVVNAPYPTWGQNLCWAYDPAGNRLQQTASNVPITPSNGACTFAPSGTNLQNVWTSYNVQNQMTQTSAPGWTDTPTYDAAGDVSNDGTNAYLYDAEGRICAVQTLSGAYGYLYDAAGHRVAKGSITLLSCDITSNGFSQTAAYVVDGGGQQLTELDGGNNWKHTNVYAIGRQIGTYDSSGLHFYFDDPLGTRRAQANAAGVLEAVYQSLPYGDDLNSAGPAGDPTENHFTGKERDTESGNDYMFARYYNSATGRFLSPDWDAKSSDPVPYAKLGDPQSLNLFSYVLNNPVGKADADGHQPPPGEEIEIEARSGVPEDETAIEVRQVTEAGAYKTALTPVVTPTPEGQAFAKAFSDFEAPVNEAIEKEVDRETGGEPPQLAAGKAAHKNEEIRPGEKPEVPTPSGTGRMDRYNEDAAHIREIKPDNPRQVRAGAKQLARYKDEMEQATGRKHTTELTKYKTKPLPKDTPP